MASTSKLHKALEKKAALKKLEAELQALESSEDYKKEAALLADLDQLLNKHSIKDQDLVDVLAARSPVKIKKASGSDDQQPSSGGTGRKRWTKVYVNPNTNEVVKAASGMNSKLREWKAEHGGETVEGWRNAQKENDLPDNEGVPKPKGDPIHGS